MEQKLTPNLWFDNNALEAAEFYINDVFKGDGKIVHVANYPEASDQAGQPVVVEWEMCGQRYVGINGGPQFPQTEAFSIQINCDTQEEIDSYWEVLTADGGAESMCGWCRDKFGVSWQVTPRGIERMYSDSDRDRVNRAWSAMMKMRKLDIAALQAAADGETAAA